MASDEKTEEPTPKRLRESRERGQVAKSQEINHWFMFLVVLNLLGAFKALGTLMAVGLMILPATAARYWVSTITSYLVLTFVLALLSSWAGLIISYYAPEVPSGPAIVLVAGALFVLSLLFGPHGLRLTSEVRRGSERPADTAPEAAE